MVRAILAGTKTQTRRKIAICDAPISLKDFFAAKKQKGIPSNAVNVRNGPYYLKCDSPLGSRTVSSRVVSPYGHSGDQLWVKENFRWIEGLEGMRSDLQFQADAAFVNVPEDVFSDTVPSYGRLLNWTAFHPRAWRSCLLMPRWASRITLEVTDIRVERLQDISERDARAEGVEREWSNDSGESPGRYLYYTGFTGIGSGHASTKEAYRHLWESINGPGSWDANPWVWVVEFKSLEVAS
jgi:hypothetical protein